jgi:hypothetical protein
MFRLQRRPPGAGCSFASRFKGTSEPRSVEVAVGAGAGAGSEACAGAGSEAGAGSPVGLDPSDGTAGGILLTLTVRSCGKGQAGRVSASVWHCINFQNLVARGSLFACGWGQITHRLASYGRLGHPGHLFCARAWSV